MEDVLDGEVAFFTSQAFSINTKRTYRSHRQSYIDFCNRMGYAPVPASSSTICRYAAYLARTLKFNSVKQYLNIIRLMHREWNLPNPLQDNFPLSCTLRGIRRHLGDNVVRKKAITPEMLRQIFKHLNISVSFDATFWAACLTMFYGLLRRSNVLLTSAATFDVNKHLRRRDISYLPWGVMLHIRWSKVIQFRSRTFELPLPRLHNNVLCPAQAIFHCQNLADTSNLDTPAFVYKTGSSLKVLTSGQFVGRLRQTLLICGINASEIATHSFRRGGATFCYSTGMSAENIKLLGDWRSSCYQSYIENDTAARFDLVKRMQQHL